MQQPTNKWRGRTFRFNWGMTIFTLVLFPVLLNFGFWQLDREQQKVQLQAQYDQRASASPINVNDIDWSNTDLGWTHVTARGTFDSDRQFMLDNRILDSKVGYEIITPFQTDTGTILVNRGWIGQGETRADIPDINASESVMQIYGHIYVPDGETLVLGMDAAVHDTWPRLIQKVDIQQLGNSLEMADIKPFVVRLTDSSPGVLQTNWAAINMRPETHRAYAIQWFIMAGVLIILYTLFSFRHPEN